MVDNSVVLSWCLDDEEHAVADHAMRLTVERGAVVPQLWWYEVRNALTVNERRGRLTAQQARATLADRGARSVRLRRRLPRGRAAPIGTPRHPGRSPAGRRDSR